MPSDSRTAVAGQPVVETLTQVAEGGGDAPRARRRKHKLSPLAKREERRFWLFLLPWVIGFIGFGAGPLIGSIVLSLTNYSLLSAPKFTGLANYRRMFEDPLFYKSMANTAYFGIAS